MTQRPTGKSLRIDFEHRVVRYRKLKMNALQAKQGAFQNSVSENKFEW